MITENIKNAQLGGAAFMKERNRRIAERAQERREMSEAVKGILERKELALNEVWHKDGCEIRYRRGDHGIHVMKIARELADDIDAVRSEFAAERMFRPIHVDLVRVGDFARWSNRHEILKGYCRAFGIRLGSNEQRWDALCEKHWEQMRWWYQAQRGEAGEVAA